MAERPRPELREAPGRSHLQRDCKKRVSEALWRLRTPLATVAVTNRGDVQFELLPPFSHDCDAHLRAKYGAANKLLAAEFRSNRDEIFMSVHGGHQDTKGLIGTEKRYAVCLLACLYLGDGELVSAAVLRLNGGSGAERHKEKHVQIKYQATTHELRDHGLGRLLTVSLLLAAAVAGHKYATVAVAGKDVEGYWEKMRFGPPPSGDCSARRVIDLSQQQTSATTVWFRRIRRKNLVKAVVKAATKARRRFRAHAVGPASGAAGAVPTGCAMRTGRPESEQAAGADTANIHDVDTAGGIKEEQGPSDGAVARHTPAAAHCPVVGAVLQDEVRLSFSASRAKAGQVQLVQGFVERILQSKDPKFTVLSLGASSKRMQPPVLPGRHPFHLTIHMSSADKDHVREYRIGGLRPLSPTVDDQAVLRRWSLRDEVYFTVDIERVQSPPTNLQPPQPQPNQPVEAPAAAAAQAPRKSKPDRPVPGREEPATKRPRLGPGADANTGALTAAAEPAAAATGAAEAPAMGPAVPAAVKPKMARAAGTGPARKADAKKPKPLTVPVLGPPAHRGAATCTGAACTQPATVAPAAAPTPERRPVGPPAGFGSGATQEGCATVAATGGTLAYAAGGRTAVVPLPGCGRSGGTAAADAPLAGKAAAQPGGSGAAPAGGSRALAGLRVGGQQQGGEAAAATAGKGAAKGAAGRAGAGASEGAARLAVPVEPAFQGLRGICKPPVLRPTQLPRRAATDPSGGHTGLPPSPAVAAAIPQRRARAPNTNAADALRPQAADKPTVADLVEVLESHPDREAAVAIALKAITDMEVAAADPASICGSGHS